MTTHRRLLPAVLAGCALAAAAPFAAQAQGSGGRVLAYPPYERTPETTDPFAQDASCQSQYQMEVREIEAEHRAGGQACFHPNNGECHTANNAKKATRLQAANTKLYQCNRQAQAARQNAGRTPSQSQTATQPPGRVDYEAINESIRRQAQQQAAEYARRAAEARAQAAAAQAAAAQAAADQAWKAEAARRWAEANRLIDVLAGRRPPLLP
jgi:hypothetical protein